ncbi:hypothetical protein Hdeb2414_s1266g01001531 [Helianthus debilis subsp. tardiflorus]
MVAMEAFIFSFFFENLSYSCILLRKRVTPFANRAKRLQKHKINLKSIVSSSTSYMEPRTPGRSKVSQHISTNVGILETIYNLNTPIGDINLILTQTFNILPWRTLNRSHHRLFTCRLFLTKDNQILFFFNITSGTLIPRNLDIIAQIHRIRRNGLRNTFQHTSNRTTSRRSIRSSSLGKPLHIRNIHISCILKPVFRTSNNRIITRRGLSILERNIRRIITFDEV